jgi:hypothetical protein
MVEILKERGFFWWFNDPGHRANSKDASIPGSLAITGDGEISLETDGALCLADELNDWGKDRTFPPSRRIAGWLAPSGKYVLLEGLELTDFSFSDELPQQQKFSAALCTRRESPSSFPETYRLERFVELRIDLSGFEDWLELDSILVDREYSEGEEVHVRVSYKEWQFKYTMVAGDFSIESNTTGGDLFGFGSVHPRRHAQFAQRYDLVFRPDSPKDASSLRYTYTKLEEILAVLVGSYCRLSWPILVSKEEPFDAWDTLYFYRGAPAPRPVNRYLVWVPFKKIDSVFGKLLLNWLNGSEAFGAGYYLYVAALRIPHQYAEHRFVNLTWSVEALHRKWLAEPGISGRIQSEQERVARILTLLPDGYDKKWLRKRLKYAHEPPLEARILDCFRKLPFGFGKGELEKFAKACADRRNDISHKGGPRDGTDYGSFHAEVSSLAEALDHLFHALILHQIGVDSATISEVVRNSMVCDRIATALARAGLHIKAEGGS